MPTRHEKFDRGDFEQRQRLLEARDAELLAAARRSGMPEQTDDEDSPGESTASGEDHETTRQHLLSLGYTNTEIDTMFAGPRKG